MAKKQGKFRSFWDRLQRKSRYVVLNNETFEEKRSFSLSPFSILIYLLFGFLLSITLAYFLFAYTPLNSLIPGVVNNVKERELIEMDKNNLNRLAQLQEEVRLKEQYILNVRTILRGDVTITEADSVLQLDSTLSYANLDLSNSMEDSLLRKEIEQEDRYRISPPDSPGARDNKMSGVFFFTPLKGSITNSFGGDDTHHGVDIVAPENEAVKSTLDGTVVFAGWTSDNGHVIQVQHAHNLLSVYKHNSVLLKQQGDKVRAGEPIAIIGNTGDLSTGAHLHFELWHNGNALNPQEFIAF